MLSVSQASAPDHVTALARPWVKRVSPSTLGGAPKAKATLASARASEAEHDRALRPDPGREQAGGDAPDHGARAVGPDEEPGLGFERP